MITQKHLNILTPILPFYSCSIEDCIISKLGDGLINDTFLIKSPTSQFVLQCINLHVFPQPEFIAHNAELIHNHLNDKALYKNYPFISIGHIKNNEDKLLTYINNEYWRAITYVDNTYTVNTIDNLQQASLVAQAFATFTANLSDFDSKTLADTIPNFHCIKSRLLQFEKALKSATPEKIEEADLCITFINNNKDFIEHVNEITQILPSRVTHNDTKINNLLFCKNTNKPKAVIDLDTCMSGFLMNDFGDLVRTTCVNIDENNTNLKSMNVRLDFFEVITKSYINVFHDMSMEEKESLVIGAKLLPFMLAIRFLTDYLNNNVYFHSEYESHNLDRAKNQFQLFSLFNEKHDELMKIMTQSIKSEYKKQ